MGCGSTRNYGNHLLKDQDFLAEAFSAENKVHKGVLIDDNKNIQSVKQVSDKNPAFLEEIIDNADESGCIMPWLLNIVPPEEDLIENKEEPSENLKIEHVFGYRSYDVRQNVFFTDDDNVVYTSGALGIVQNKNTLEQKIFGGLEWDDGGMCHDENITSIAVFGGEVPMIATGQIKTKPVIYVWSPSNPSIVYHTFHQQKGSKEVSRLAFDYKGEYLFSLGRDKSNSFYFFHLESKSKYWTSRTGDNIIFDVAFSPSSSNFCLVGVKTVIFGDYLTKTLENQSRNREDLMDETFTAVCYTKSLICLTSTQSGKILIWQNSKYVGEVKVGVSAIHNMHFAAKLNYVYVSDSDKKLYTYAFNASAEGADEIMKLHECIELPSIAKAFDLNSKEEMVIGLKHGMILLKEANNPLIKIDKVITKAHYFGKIYGLCYVPDKYILTTGEDNRLMIWNIENKTCEALAFLDDKYRDLNISHTSKHYSKSISYCPKLKHIAIGLNNGEVTIRNGLMTPSEKIISNIIISKKEIELVKYCPNGMFLAVSANSGEFSILNTQQSYNTVFKLKGHESAIVQLDWDITSNFIQAVSQENEYLFYDVKKETIVPDPLNMRSAKWHDITCKFGYTIQGIFLGNTDPNFINTVALSNSKKLIASGDDDKCLNLYRYPCYRDNPKTKRYYGHSDQLTSVVFTHDDSRIISIAQEDKSIVIWKVSKD